MIFHFLFRSNLIFSLIAALMEKNVRDNKFLLHFNADR